MLQDAVVVFLNCVCRGALSKKRKEKANSGKSAKMCMQTQIKQHDSLAFDCGRRAAEETKGISCLQPGELKERKTDMYSFFTPSRLLLHFQRGKKTCFFLLSRTAA